MPGGTRAAASQTMRIATYNLRYDSMPDNITVQETIANLPDPLVNPGYFNFTGEQPWSTRRIKVAQHLLSEGIVLAGFQEGLIRQVNDLQELFGDGWDWVGVGRDDGIAAGEFNPIFYKKSDVTLLDNQTFWLSPTPFDVSKYPGAGSFRICNLVHAILHDQATSKDIHFTYMNTHLDDQSDDQRRYGASLILYRARYEAWKTKGPVLVTGDFNSGSTGQDAGAYEIITGVIPPVPINATFAADYAVPNGTLEGFVMDDLKGKAARINVWGDFATYTGFDGNTSVWTRIDFVLGASSGDWSVDAYKVQTSLTDDGIYASDHRPSFADITLT